MVELQLIATDFNKFLKLGKSSDPSDLEFIKKIKTNLPYLIITTGSYPNNLSSFDLTTFNIFLTTNKKGLQVKINSNFEVLNTDNTRSYDHYSSNGLYVINQKELIDSNAKSLQDLIKLKKIKGFPYYFTSNGRPALFLDRDGIIVYDKGYPRSPSEIELIPEIIEIINFAKSKNMLVISISNQSGIARGKIKLRELSLINQKIYSLVSLDALYNCPYFKDGSVKFYSHESIFRKPYAGMILKACKDFNIDLTKSFMIGDKDNDKINIPHLTTYLLEDKYPVKNKHFSSFKELSSDLFSKIR